MTPLEILDRKILLKEQAIFLFQKEIEDLKSESLRLKNSEFAEEVPDDRV